MSDYGSEIKGILNNFFFLFFKIYFLFENFIHNTVSTSFPSLPLAIPLKFIHSSTIIHIHNYTHKHTYTPIKSITPIYCSSYVHVFGTEHL